MDYISGRLLTEKGFIKGYIGLEGNELIEKGLGNPPNIPIMKGIITPSFFNMHTHIGDTFIRLRNIPLPHDLIRLVTPPDGLKHTLLKSTTKNEIVHGMKQALQEMKSSGICCFCDFRENGTPGIKIIKEALKECAMHSIILSRPKTLHYNTKEIDLLLKNSEGIAISSMEEWNYEDLIEIVKRVKKQKKLFSLHVSERIRENIDKVISLSPDFIIHMTKATKLDLQIIKNNKIPIVICPRSNTFFQTFPPLKKMKEIGNMLLIGSDNGMLHPPNLLDEIRHIMRMVPNLFSTEELLDMMTYQSRKVLNSKDVIQAANLPTSYLVLDCNTLKPVYTSIYMRE
jgi:cytosine/adenosine deaminase-related metal-dependent hydrolase